MIIELINHLTSSGLFTGYAFTDWRDDAAYPFSNNISACLLRVQGGKQDQDIGQVGVDIFLFSQVNATNSQRGQLMTLSTQVSDWLLFNQKFGRVYAIDIPTQPAGPYKDEKNRYYSSIRIQLRRNGGYA